MVISYLANIKLLALLYEIYALSDCLVDESCDALLQYR